jgi:hypothetical protein
VIYTNVLVSTDPAKILAETERALAGAPRGRVPSLGMATPPNASCPPWPPAREPMKILINPTSLLVFQAWMDLCQ